MLDHDTLIERCLAFSSEVRYVAVYRDGILRSRQRADLTGASTSESDRYEELLVNPTGLTLFGQRGTIGCGGLRYLLVRYGNFFQFIRPVPNGHVSIALEPVADVGALLPVLDDLLAEWTSPEAAG